MQEAAQACLCLALLHANNKVAELPMQVHMLTSDFIISILESINLLNDHLYILLVSVAKQENSSLPWSETLSCNDYNLIAAILFCSSYCLMSLSIRIYHECEGRIEKSVPRIAVWHHEACRVMTNGIPRDGFFYPTLTRIMDSFSYSPLFLCIYLFIYLFTYKISFQKSLKTLRCNFA